MNYKSHKNYLKTRDILYICQVVFEPILIYLRYIQYTLLIPDLYTNLLFKNNYFTDLFHFTLLSRVVLQIYMHACMYICMSVWVVKDTDRDTLTGSTRRSALTESDL